MRGAMMHPATMCRFRPMPQKVIVGVAVGQNASDAVLLQPALQTLERRLGQLPRQLVADGGYATQSNIADLAARDIDSMRRFRRRTKIRTHCASAASHRHFFRNSFATTQAATSSSVRRERRCTTARNRSAVTASCTCLLYTSDAADERSS